MERIEEYSRLIDEMAWYGRGDIFQIAKLAKELGRNYTEDLAERKKLLIDSSGGVERQNSFYLYYKN